MSEGADLLKYVTVKVATYIGTPASEHPRQERIRRKEPWTTRWFGQLVPLGISLWWSGRKQNKPHHEVRPIDEGLTIKETDV